MPNAKELIDLSTALTEVVKSVNSIVELQDVPFDDETTRLANSAKVIAETANHIGQAGLAQLANDVRESINALNTQVAAASTKLEQIQEIKMALNIAGLVLMGAATIAGSIATGNWIGVAANVAALANNLKLVVGTA